MRRIGVNIILVLLFVILGIGTFLPLLAKIYFNEGKTLEAKYRWRMADEKFNLAVRLDPISAEYHAGIGKLYMKRAAISKDKVPILLKAEDEFKKSHELNPYNVGYLLRLAAAEVELFLADTVKYGDRFENSVRHSKEAYEKDPHNYVFNYHTGCNLLEIWGHLSETNRQYAIQRFRHCMESAPWYGNDIYKKLWNKLKDFDVLLKVTPDNLIGYENLYSHISKNNLWKYRKEAVSKIEEYKEKERPELFAQEREERERLLRELCSLAMTKNKTEGEIGWVGKSKSGENTYKDGNMYWTGTVHTVIKLPKGNAHIGISAKGDSAYDIWPYMIVELDGEEIGETYVNNRFCWKEYGFKVYADGGIKVLSVTFANDGGDWKKRMDRNLYVGEVVVESGGNE